MASLYDLTKGEEVEFYRILSQNGLDAERARALIRQPGLAQPMVHTLTEQLLPELLNRFKPLLRNQEAQLTMLRQFNRQFWNGMIGEGSFEAIGRELAYVDAEVGLHEQSVDDLEVLYVDFGSPEETVGKWWKVLVGTQPNAYLDEFWKIDSECLSLDPQARPYEPGIHRLRINLVANWKPTEHRSVDQVRAQAASKGQFLAAGEVLAAYSLHDELLRKQDGRDLPYADMAGYRCTRTGQSPWESCLDVSWNHSNRSGSVVLRPGRTDEVRYAGWAAPVINVA